MTASMAVRGLSSSRSSHSVHATATFRSCWPGVMISMVVVGTPSAMAENMLKSLGHFTVHSIRTSFYLLRSHLTLAKVSGRTKTNGNWEGKSYGSLVQHDEGSVMPSQIIHSQQFSLEKVHTRSQTVTRSTEEVTYGFPRGIKSSEEAELAYPP